jgi:hypothetical protein
MIGKVVVLVYDTPNEMCRSLIRFGEHYESPRFKGEVFSVYQYRKWYEQQNGAWTYYNDWGGYNFPGYVLKKFFDGDFNPLSEDEKDVLNMIANNIDLEQEFYVIAIARTYMTALPHEMAHATFYLSEEYRKYSTSIVNSLPNLGKYLTKIQELGYHESVAIDEAQAYLVDGIAYLYKNMKIGLSAREYFKYFLASLKLRNKIKQIVKNNLKKS